jgi:hypothetical protein
MVAALPDSAHRQYGLYHRLLELLEGEQIMVASMLEQEAQC